MRVEVTGLTGNVCDATDPVVGATVLFVHTLFSDVEQFIHHVRRTYRVHDFSIEQEDGIVYWEMRLSCGAKAQGTLA